MPQLVNMLAMGLLPTCGAVAPMTPRSEVSLLRSPGQSGQLEQRGSASRILSTKSCEDLRDHDGGWIMNIATVCAESEIRKQCSGRRSKAAAASFCSATGARMCNYEELAADAALGSGCELDNSRVWSSTCARICLIRDPPHVRMTPALLAFRQAVHQSRTSGLFHRRRRQRLQQLSPPPLRGDGLARYTIAPGALLRGLS